MQTKSCSKYVDQARAFCYKQYSALNVDLCLLFFYPWFLLFQSFHRINLSFIYYSLYLFSINSVEIKLINSKFPLSTLYFLQVISLFSKSPILWKCWRYQTPQINLQKSVTTPNWLPMTQNWWIQWLLTCYYFGFCDIRTMPSPLSFKLVSSVTAPLELLLGQIWQTQPLLAWTYIIFS